MTGALSPGQFAAGAVLLAITLGCCGGFAWLLLRTKLDHLTGVPRAVAFAVMLIAGMLCVHVLPLVLGVLTRGTVVLAAVVLVSGTFWLVGRPARRETAPSLSLRGAGELISLDGAHWLLAGAGALLAAAWCLAYVQANATVHVSSVDVLAFHLPGVIRFIQTGTMWQTTQYLVGQAQGNYPQFGDLLLLAAVLPWHSVAFIRYVDPLLLALAVASIYGISRELHVRPATSLLVACAVISIRPALGTALVDDLTDPAFLATFSAGVLFLFRHWRTRRRSELVLAGVAFGIVLGTKWYGLTEIPALIVVWIVAGALAGRGRRELLRDTGVLVGVIALVGGIWMLRNLILTGNPVFDYPVRVLGLTIFPAPPSPIRSLLGFSLAHYLTNSSVLRGYVWPEFRDEFGLVGGLLVVGVAAAAALWLADRRRSRPRVDPRVALLGAGAVALAVVYVVTPYTAQGYRNVPLLIAANTRYGMPALILAAPLLAWSVQRIGAWGLLVEAALLVEIALNLHRYLPVGGARIVGAALIVAILAATVASARRPRLFRIATASAALALAGVLALAGALALVYHDQRVLARRPYTPQDPAVSYVLARAPAHTRIAVTGEWIRPVPIAPLFGPRMQNEVDYLGPWIGHRLEQYSSAPAFRAALTRGNYPLLAVATGYPPNHDPPEARWARAAGYVPLTESLLYILMGRPSADAASAHRAPQRSLAQHVLQHEPAAVGDGA